MGLQISECSTIGEYKTRIGSENGGDYIYVNKFNHSLVFSDNGTRSVMSEPVIQEDNVAWYLDYNSIETDSARLGNSDHPFATLEELLMFLPKNTNGHTISVYVKASSEAQAVALNGFENLDIHGWGNNSSKYPVFSFTNCKNVKVFSTDTNTPASATDCSIGSVTNSDIIIAGGTTYTGIINIAGPVVNSEITSVADVVIDTAAPSEGPTIFDIKEHSVVSFMGVSADVAPKTIKVDNSEVTADSVICANITAVNNATVRINTLNRSKDQTTKQTTISADGLSNISVSQYAREASEDTTNRDFVVVNGSNGSRISMIGKTGEMIPTKAVTAQTGSYITMATITGYLNSSTVVNPALEAHMASTIMYYSADIDQDHSVTPTETKDTMGQINTATSADLSGYIQYNASTVSNS